MSYIGKQPVVGKFTKLDDLSFDGSTQAFTMQSGGENVIPLNEQNMLVTISGVVQEPNSAYTVSGSTITFTGAPESTDSFYGIVYGNVLDIGTPSDATVTTAKLASSWYHKNNQTLTSISLSSSENALLAGPITVSGTVTVPSGSTVTIV